MERLCSFIRSYQTRPRLCGGLYQTVTSRRYSMNQVIYLVGLIVVVMAILSFVGIHV